MTEDLARRFERYAESAQRGAAGDDPKWAEGRAAAYRRCAKDVREAIAATPPTTKPNSNARPPISPSGGNGRPSHTTPQPSSDAEALKHDLSRAISNHAADLSQPSGEPWDRLAYRQSFRAQGSQPSSEARAVALLRAALAYIPEETITHNEQLLEARSYIATLPPNGDKESR